MRRFPYIILTILLMSVVSLRSEGQIVSFENMNDLYAWKAENGNVAISSLRYKFGTSSLRINWRPGAVVTMESAPGLLQAQSQLS